MPDNRYAAPVVFSLEPSGRLQTAVIAAHGLALSAGLASAVPLAGKLLLGMAIPVHLFIAVKRHRKQRHLIRYSTLSGWEVDGEAVSIMASTVITPFAIWLHYKKTAGCKEALLIVRDAMPEAEFRQLIVQLKISAA